MDNQEQELWEGYCANHSVEMRNHLAVHYDYLAESTAKRHSNWLTWVNYDDLLQLCRLGILEAIKGFDFRLGYQFSTYANLFIHGQVFASNEVQRGFKGVVRQHYRMVNDAIEYYWQYYNSEPTSKQIAERTGLTETQIDQTLETIARVRSLSLEGLIEEYGDLDEGDAFTHPAAVQEARQAEELHELARSVDECMRELKIHDRLILEMAHYKDMTDREIALTLLGCNPPPAEPTAMIRLVNKTKKARQRAEKRLERLLSRSYQA